MGTVLAFLPRKLPRSPHCSQGSHSDHKTLGQKGAYFQEELSTCERLLSKEG